MDISIHAPLAGCDLANNMLSNDKNTFQSTHPLWGATARLSTSATRSRRFQSTHPLRGATVPPFSASCVALISIHAPLAGCDLTQIKNQLLRAISIHAPLAGCDFFLAANCASREISIHAPLAGCDTILRPFSVTAPAFQSTHPLRGATAKMHKIFCAFCDNRQFYRVSPSGVPSVGALFTYSRGLQRAGAGANLPVNGCALGLRAKSSASPQAGRSACSRSVRFYSRTSCRGNKTAGCRVPDP